MSNSFTDFHILNLTMPAKRKPKTSYTILNKGCENEIVTDLLNLKWKIGQQIATGGFGAIYLVHPYQQLTKPKMEYVIKIEPFSNGPLFTEMHFYQRCCKLEMIDSWVRAHGKIDSLAIPAYIASGSHSVGTTKFRFLVMERFGGDLDQFYTKSSGPPLRKLICQIAIRMLYALEYIHDKGYVHSDIKASNIMPGISKDHKNQLFLLDYGLVGKFKNEKIHKAFRMDDRKAHDGTLEFTSIDAHNGTEPSRRSDLEILGYNLLKWSVGTLPWEHKSKLDPEFVKKEKIKFMKSLPQSLSSCFKDRHIPSEIQAFFTYVSHLKYEDKPEYIKLREGMFNQTLKEEFKCPYKDNFYNTPITNTHNISDTKFIKPHVPDICEIKQQNRTVPTKKKIKPSAESPELFPSPDEAREKVKVDSTIVSGYNAGLSNHSILCASKGLRPRRKLNGLKFPPKIDEPKRVENKGTSTLNTIPNFKYRKVIKPLLAFENESSLSANGPVSKLAPKFSPQNATNSKNFNQTCYLTPPETFDKSGGGSSNRARNSMSSIFSDDEME